jgi:hypothetical protein
MSLATMPQPLYGMEAFLLMLGLGITYYVLVSYDAQRDTKELQEYDQDKQSEEETK